MFAGTRVVFPTIGQLALKDITPPMILSILQKAAKNNGVSVMAEAKRTMYCIFELAAETFRVDANPVHQWREALPKNKTQHKRPLTHAEIGQLLRDVDGHGGNYQTQPQFHEKLVMPVGSIDNFFLPINQLGVDYLCAPTLYR